MDQEQKKPVTINPLSTYQSFKKDSCQEKIAARERATTAASEWSGEVEQWRVADWSSSERRRGAAAGRCGKSSGERQWRDQGDGIE